MGMSRQRLRELFDQVVELPAAERAAFLDAHCSDPQLRARIERLLASDAKEGAPVPGSPETLAAAMDGPVPPPWYPGQRIGPFTLVAPPGPGWIRHRLPRRARQRGRAPGGGPETAASRPAQHARAAAVPARATGAGAAAPPRHRAPDRGGGNGRWPGVDRP